jgi:hypothetical protein
LTQTGQNEISMAKTGQNNIPTAKNRPSQSKMVITDQNWTKEFKTGSQQPKTGQTGENSGHFKTNQNK